MDKMKAAIRAMIVVLLDKLPRAEVVAFLKSLVIELEGTDGIPASDK